jgi:23S rRNA pseudouridine2604 synthase
MRINKFFSDQGICSRREADRWVEEGRIQINSKVAKLGDQIHEDDIVALDGKILDRRKKKLVILAYHKPVGIECTSDPRSENNIIDAVNYPERVVHIGRLDMMSEGLILLTNEGDLVNLILRGRYGHEKEYLVTYDQPIDRRIKEIFETGVDIGDERGPTKPCRVELVGSRRAKLVLTEGRNRQIRRMAEAVGLRVMRLKRIRVLNILLGDLPSGQWRHLTAAEEKALLSTLEEVREK